MSRNLIPWAGVSIFIGILLLGNECVNVLSPSGVFNYLPFVGGVFLILLGLVLVLIEVTGQGVPPRSSGSVSGSNLPEDGKDFRLPPNAPTHNPSQR